VSFVFWRQDGRFDSALVSDASRCAARQDRVGFRPFDLLTLPAFVFQLACQVIAAVLALTLFGCATYNPPAPSKLVVNGQLTQEGKQLRDRGIEFYQSHDDAKAYEVWRILADQGHGESLFKMGIMTRDGLGVPADAGVGLDWMRKAADAGYGQAYLDLGAAYANGALVSKDAAEAVRLWRKGAALGEIHCASLAGEFLISGRGVPRDVEQGIALLTRAAEAEVPDPNAQAILGRSYLDGDPVAQDYIKARYWLEKASAFEDSSALHNLALIYDRGNGVDVDKRRAISLYERAAAKGNPQSLNNLGYAYRHGEGVTKDLDQAVSYFEQAHALGLFDATINLGDMTFKGWGTKRDPAKAIALYKAAAEAGHPVAQCRYAQALRHGDGVARNSAGADLWRAKALSTSPRLECDTVLDRMLR
jgi:TPR repeat protein